MKHRFASDLEFTSTYYGLNAVLRKRLEGEWQISEYDSAFGYYCGSHTYESKAEALAWLARSKFKPRHATSGPNYVAV